VRYTIAWLIRSIWTWVRTSPSSDPLLVGSAPCLTPPLMGARETGLAILDATEAN
jgi:hypothetical protein